MLGIHPPTPHLAPLSTSNCSFTYSFASLGLTDYSRVGMLGLRCERVMFGAEQSPGAHRIGEPK